MAQIEKAARQIIGWVVPDGGEPGYEGMERAGLLDEITRQ